MNPQLTLAVAQIRQEELRRSADAYRQAASVSSATSWSTHLRTMIAVRLLRLPVRSEGLSGRWTAASAPSSQAEPRVAMRQADPPSA
jgi:hypothetical protein